MCSCTFCEAKREQGPGPYCPRCGIRFAFTSMVKRHPLDLCPPCDAALIAECRPKPEPSIARLRVRYNRICSRTRRRAVSVFTAVEPPQGSEQ